MSTCTIFWTTRSAGREASGAELSAGAWVFCGDGEGGGACVCAAARSIGAKQNSASAAEQPRIANGCFNNFNFGNFSEINPLGTTGREGIGHHLIRLLPMLIDNPRRAI